MATPNLLGPWGEAIAAAYLRKKRYKIIATNYKTRFGEIDLIAVTRREIVFVEVKLRKSDRYVQAREYVGTQKQNRIRTSAEIWLQSNPSDLQPRFDVIEIYAPDGMQTQTPSIVHLEDAFQ